MKAASACLLLSLLTVTSLSGQKLQPQPSEAEKAIDEFRVQTRTLNLQKSNQSSHTPRPKDVQHWHGRFYENFRNDALDAVPHEVRQGGQQNSLLRRNQFGFNLSGPVPVRHAVPGHKTYVSLSYEGVRQTVDPPILATVPRLLERTGDFSPTLHAAGQPLPVYDPHTTQPNPAYDASPSLSTANLQYLRVPFPRNRIPVSRLDPVALNALTYYPAPNVAIGPFFQNNYFANTPESNDADGVIGAVEVDLTPRNRLLATPSFSNGRLSAAPLFPSEANPGQ